MSNLEREKKELPCPKCKRPIKTTLYDMFNKKEAKCSCGSMYKFDSSAASNLRSAISNLEKAEEKFTEAMQKIMSTADIVIKN